MSKKHPVEFTEDTEKGIVKEFNKLSYSLNRWDAWEAMITAIACTIALEGDPNNKRRAERQAEYDRAIERLNGQADTVAKMLELLTEHFREHPQEDILSKMYMALELGSKARAQVFTPWHISIAMGMLCLPEDIMDEAKDKGYVSICDPTCGAGVNLLAGAYILAQRGVNYQDEVLFVGQDLDSVVAKMCYIQLSLIDAAAYICVANTLTNPISGPSTLIPFEKEGQDFWYTPAYWSDKWQLKVLKETLEFMNASKSA